MSDSVFVNSCADFYLGLLSRTLRGTLFAPEPDPLHREAYKKHYSQGSAVTLVSAHQLENIRGCIVEILKSEVPGDVIETGVWRGGVTIFMKAVLKAYGAADRCVWVADSFEGLPEPNAERFPTDATFQEMARTDWNNLAATLEEVRSNFEAFGLMDAQVRFLKGFFSDTLPTAPIDKLSLMRLDGDYYESTMDALTNLYDKLSIGGMVIVDDYGNSSCQCKDAVDTFRVQRGIQDTMVQVDSNCYWWRKTSNAYT